MPWCCTSLHLHVVYGTIWLGGKWCFPATKVEKDLAGSEEEEFAREIFASHAPKIKNAAARRPSPWPWLVVVP